MGAVHQETPNQNRGVHEYEKYNFSDLTCLREFILNRSELDESYKCKQYSSNNPFMASHIPNFRELICVMYVDLDNLINGAELNIYERLVINKLMEGYDFFDIEEIYLNDNYDIAEKLFEGGILKLKEYNDQLRYAHFKKIGLNVQERTCSRCGKTKVVTEFTPDKTKASGYKGICKKCRRKGQIV